MFRQRKIRFVSRKRQIWWANKKSLPNSDPYEFFIMGCRAKKWGIWQMNPWCWLIVFRVYVCISDLFVCAKVVLLTNLILSFHPIPCHVCLFISRSQPSIPVRYIFSINDDEGKAVGVITCQKTETTKFPSHITFYWQFWIKNIHLFVSNWRQKKAFNAGCITTIIIKSKMFHAQKVNAIDFLKKSVFSTFVKWQILHPWINHPL